MLRALIWDVDGTLAETERDGHRVAFNDAFAAMGLPWRWSVERYGDLLATSGGLERLLRDLAERGVAPRAACERLALARELHRRKMPPNAARPRGRFAALGVRRLMQQARGHGAAAAIATTTGRAIGDVPLSRHLGAHWAGGFAASCAPRTRR
jgi:phosphoglycolate phosphatase-like HAD superfamily hydrolase